MTRAERQRAESKARRVAILRIRGFVRRATDSERCDGAAWYPTARSIAEGIAVETGYSTRQVAGVIAALSPGLRWERNVICARLICLWQRAGGRRRKPGEFLFHEGLEPVVETYTYENVRRTVRILAGEDPSDVLSGQKVVPFYLSILNPETESQAVLDGHIANALRGEDAGLREVKSITVGEYRAWSDAFRYVAAADGSTVPTLQATVWLVHKREKDNRLPF